MPQLWSGSLVVIITHRSPGQRSFISVINVPLPSTDTCTTSNSLTFGKSTEIGVILSKFKATESRIATILVMPGKNTMNIRLFKCDCLAKFAGEGLWPHKRQHILQILDARSDSMQMWKSYVSSMGDAQAERTSQSMKDADPREMFMEVRVVNGGGLNEVGDSHTGWEVNVQARMLFSGDTPVVSYDISKVCYETEGEHQGH
ncbi:uncharacterized protein BT62DRAFT_995732 [Guyanagaster necrorhizus]|uniref:Uncharacterized protein n=1 Tax=Guyanagaster necrorhizus TaxID=856835 RepID=A0A9P8AQL5_9AGAR|nr:uncharacterized protein BT62DRAFT_995732 [Guyanagaster necrorhizus MCA 3950]KAG7443976.1 hypothetical protein BT62DRAFT_995732 [Guyanagaster necrorhizus MCA 3950]